MWARSVQYAIGKLWQWADTNYKRLEEIEEKLFVEELRKEDVDFFVKSMQRQAKITGARPKKDM
jgi:hypothetical protein